MSIISNCRLAARTRFDLTEIMREGTRRPVYCNLGTKDLKFSDLWGIFFDRLSETENDRCKLLTRPSLGLPVEKGTNERQKYIKQMHAVE